MQEIDIDFSNGVSEPGLLDPGSQIVVIQQDLAKEINAQVSPGLRIEMEGANSHTNWTLGCAESLSMQIGGIPFKLHAHVVERAPFRLLLGRPFTHQLLCCLEDLPSGKVEVSIRDPRDISCRVYIPSRPRRIHVASLRVSSYTLNHTSLSIAHPILESSATSDLNAPSEPPDLTTIESPIGPLQFAHIPQGWADAIAAAPSAPNPFDDDC